VILFLLCCVSASYQQRGFPFYPRSYYNPRFDFFSNPYASKRIQAFENDPDNEDVYVGEDEQIIEARVPFNKKTNNAQPASLLERSNFFLPAAYLSSLFSLVPVTTITTTVSTTVTSTATVASVISCIGSSQFAINAAGTSSTSACIGSRRRRNVIGSTAEDIEEIKPSQIQALEVSVAPRSSRNVNKPEVLSSQESVGEDEQQQPDFSRQKRKFSLALTVTSTFTSYSFTTTTLKKSFSLATSGAPAANAAGGGGLLCLPSGYSIC